MRIIRQAQCVYNLRKSIMDKNSPPIDTSLAPSSFRLANAAFRMPFMNK